MYCKNNQIVNIYIYKYVPTYIRKFRLFFFFCTKLKTKIYF